MTDPGRHAVFHCARAWLGGRSLARDVTLRAADGTLAAVEEATAVPEGATRLRGVVVPGFVSAHSHAFHRALRGRTSGGRPTFWSWRDAMYSLAERLTPDSLRDLATATFAELLLAGYTSVGEFHYLHHGDGGRPYDDRNETTRALLDAAAATGIRLTVLDACYLQGSPGHPVEGAQRRFADGSAEEWAERVDSLGPLPARTSLGAAVHSVRAVDPTSIAVVAAWSRHRGAVLHAHVSEQPAEGEASLAAYGASPTAVLAAAGALDARFTAVHATHVTAADRRLLGEAASTACVCPTTEEDLADGLCDLAGLLDAGVTLSLGSDSNAVVDPFAEARALEGHERLRTGRRGTLGPEALLAAMTRGGATSLGHDDALAGLAPGSPCDLVEVATGSVRLAGCDGEDLLAAIVQSAAPSDVRTVVVGGEVVVEDGRHARVDAPEALAVACAQVWR